MLNDWIEPEWDVPLCVRALSTTRRGGVSGEPWRDLNLGAHVGDDEDCVMRNRRILAESVGLSVQTVWLNQVHGTTVVDAANLTTPVDADASFCCESNVACVVMTADCLPVLFTNMSGSCVAAAHAGWRGLLDGVLEATIDAMPGENDELIAWMGPAIGPGAFEVGPDVYSQFVAQNSVYSSAFRAVREDKWLMDIYAIAKMRMLDQGVSAVYGGGYCTYSDEKRFFSYRRDGQTGRMATLIWIEDEEI